MKNDISCQFLIAERVLFDSKEKRHSAYNILNKITVPILPAAVITNVLFKFSFSKEQDLTELENKICVLDPSKNNVYIGQLPKLKNLREAVMKPGIDGVVEIRFPVVESGEYEYVVYTQNEKIFSYPLYIEAIQN